MEFLLFDLIAGFAIRLLIWIVSATVRLVCRSVSHLVVHHPFLTAMLLLTAQRNDWLIQFAPLVTWLPFGPVAFALFLVSIPLIATGLVILAVARFFSAHDVAAMTRRSRRIAGSASRGMRRHARRLERKATKKARRWWRDRNNDDGPEPRPGKGVADEAVDGLRPPPRPVDTERSTDGFGDPLDDSGKRLFAYREAGYRGWLDQDGHPVSEDGTRITATDADGAPIVAHIGPDRPATAAEPEPVPAVIPLGPARNGEGA
jgi:hypothetical protein